MLQHCVTVTYRQTVRQTVDRHRRTDRQTVTHTHTHTQSKTSGPHWCRMLPACSAEYRTLWWPHERPCGSRGCETRPPPLIDPIALFAHVSLISTHFLISHSLPEPGSHATRHVVRLCAASLHTRCVTWCVSTTSRSYAGSENLSRDDVS